MVTRRGRVLESIFRQASHASHAGTLERRWMTSGRSCSKRARSTLTCFNELSRFLCTGRVMCRLPSASSCATSLPPLEMTMDSCPCSIRYCPTSRVPRSTPPDSSSGKIWMTFLNGKRVGFTNYVRSLRLIFHRSCIQKMSLLYVLIIFSMVLTSSSVALILSSSGER